MVTAPATGNINYINWVKQQTVIPEFQQKEKTKALPGASTETETTEKEKVKKNTIGADGSKTEVSASFIKP